MTTVDQLLQTPEGRDLMLVAGPWEARAAEHVAIVDSIEELRDVAPASVALLTRHASSLANGYRLDIALRTAGDRELAAIAVYGEGTTSPTAIRLANRGRVALLSVAHGRDLSSLAFGLERAIRQDAGAVLTRAVEAMDQIAAAERQGSDAVLAAASAALGAPLSLSSSLPAPRPSGAAPAPFERVVVDGRIEGYVVADDTDDAATRLTVRLAAEAIGRLRTARRRRERAPARARGAAVAALVGAAPRRVPAAAERARELGVAVDGAHLAARVELDGAPPHVLLELEDELGDVLGPAWERTALDGGLLLVHTERPTHGPSTAEEEALTGAHSALELVRRGFAEYVAYCGLSRRLDGPEGLRAGAGEARASAQSARALGQPFTLTPFAALGLPRPLLDWLASDGAQLTVEESLAPLDALGPERAATAVRTLQVFLDERGSFVRTAERLHLHRNAVAYRINRIVEQLGVDLDDPDVRLTLQLACRARTLRAASPEPGRT